MQINVKMTRSGNSWAIRLPKVVPELCEFKAGGEMIMELRRQKIILRPIDKPFKGDALDEAKRDARHAWLLTVGEDDDRLVGALSLSKPK